MLAGCAGAPFGTDNKDIFESVRNADLSPRDAQRVRQTGSIGPRGSTQFEYYPARDGGSPVGGVGPAPSIGGRGAPVQPRPTRNGEGYELNFDNANLSDVVKVILGDTLRVPYIYDTRIQAQVTLSTGRAVSRQELLHVLEAILAINNAALMNGSTGYKILPVAEAGQGDVGSVAIARRGEPVPPGQGVTVLPLYNVAADAMMQLLDSFIARAGSLKADALHNLLLVRGTARERQALIDVAISFDVDWLKGKHAGIFPLQHATPEEIIGEINKMLMPGESSTGPPSSVPTPDGRQPPPAAAGGAGGATPSTIKMQSISRLNAILVLTRTQQQLRDVATWVKRLDRDNSAGLNTFVYKVENGKASDLAVVVGSTFGAQTTTPETSGARGEVAPGQGTATAQSQSLLRGREGSQQTGSQTGSRFGVPRIERPPLQRPRNLQSPQGPADPSSQQGKSDIRIVADEVNNSLLIRATAAQYEKILAVLRRIDRPPLQVLINATIAEVTLNEQLRYGVQVFLRSKGLSGGYFNGPTLTLNPSFPGLNVFGGARDDPRFMLDALAKVTNVKVVSSPSLVVVDNQPAILQVGDEVPISTQEARNLTGTDPLNTVVSNIQFRDTGVILKVTPRVNSNGNVTMDVEQEISNVVGGSEASNSLTPTIAQRRIASTISVLSGQTVVLGGLISENVTREKNRVPVLEKIPVLGDMLGSTNKERRRTELIVFIRPQVLRDSTDASNVAEELRAKLKLFEPDVSPRKRHDAWRTSSPRATR
jgi:general secretion pathway protein D